MRSAFGPIAVLIAAVLILALVVSILPGIMATSVSPGSLAVDVRTAATIFIALGYVVLALVVQALFFAPTTRRLLRAEIDSVRGRLGIDQENPAVQSLVEVEVAEKVRFLLDKAESRNPIGWHVFPEMIFWNGSSELQGWKLVHEADRLMVAQESIERVLA